jgi:hypothetical protein
VPHTAPQFVLYEPTKVCFDSPKYVLTLHVGFLLFGSEDGDVCWFSPDYSALYSIRLVNTVDLVALSDSVICAQHSRIAQPLVLKTMLYIVIGLLLFIILLCNVTIRIPMRMYPNHALLLHVSGSWTTLSYTKGRSAEEIDFRTIYSVSSTETVERSFACIFHAPSVTSCNMLKSVCVYHCVLLFFRLYRNTYYAYRVYFCYIYFCIGFISFYFISSHTILYITSIV